jgi:ABC-type amino acid transport system permease subunit
MNFKELFYKTLIEGNSWQTILKGFWVTVEITLISLVLGTLLAALVCALRLSKNRFLKGLAGVEIST